MVVIPTFTNATFSKVGQLSTGDLKNLGVNLLKFTAPALAAFFYALSQGVSLEKAWPIGLVILWGIIADYLSKLNGGKPS